MQLDCTKGQKHSSAFWLSPLESLSCRALTHSHHPPQALPHPPPPPLGALLSHLPLSLSFTLSSKHLSPLSHWQNLTLPQQRVSSLTRTHMGHTHARAPETCYLATQGWDRCRPISVGSERAVNEERGPIDGRVLLHNNLKRGGFNHFLTFRIAVWPNSHISPQSLAYICWHTFVNKCVVTDLSIVKFSTIVQQKKNTLANGTIAHQKTIFHCIVEYTDAIEQTYVSTILDGPTVDITGDSW